MLWRGRRERLLDAAREHREYLAGETLAVELELAAPAAERQPPPRAPDGMLNRPGASVHMETVKLESMQLEIALKLAPRG